MSTAIKELRSLAVRRIESAGIDWRRLDKKAKEIIVFGSYAVSVNAVSSDLDLLCIGDGQNFKSPQIHVIWIQENQIRSKKWLGSELATHVAAYGKWIKGRNTWARQTKPNSAALARKRQNITLRLEAMERHWSDLLPRFRYNQLTKLRRDLQRYHIMQKGSPPIPRALLDAEWQQQSESQAWECLLATQTTLAKPIADFLRHRGILNLLE